MAKKAPAARLVQGGAPETWHTVNGLPGHYHPTLPTPLDQPGLVTSEQLQAFIAAHAERVETARAGWEAFRQERLEQGHPDIGEFDAPACPVELVEINPSQVDNAAAAAREQLAAGTRAVRAARRNGEQDDLIVQSETDAVTAGTQES